MGYETAKALVGDGFATVLACRDLRKAQAARDKLKAEYPGSKVEAAHLDLTDLSSVRAFGERARQGGRPLDVLCNNADRVKAALQASAGGAFTLAIESGVMACPEARTKEGFEWQLASNHLGHFLLTSLLLPLMMDPERPARIVNVSSSAHLPAKMQFDDLQFTKNYSRLGAYSQSKLANILFTYELARRLPEHVTANALHPGIVNTQLVRHLIDLDPPWWKVPLQLPLVPFSWFTKSPAQGAATQIHLCLSPKVQGVTGKYFVDCSETASSPGSYDEEAARRLWEVSVELTGAPDVLSPAPAAPTW